MSIKCAVVGYGSAFAMGAFHCNQIKNTEGLELVAVAEPVKQRREEAHEREGVPVFASLTELLKESDCEMVTIVTPHDTHCALIVEALEGGRHAITEKVMCLNTAEADTMIKAAKKARKMFSVFQNRRWDTDYVTVRKVIEGGLLGEVFDIESSIGGYGPQGGWRSVKKHGGGMLYDWGAHLVDQVVQMVPAKPVRVYASMQYRVWPTDTETLALVHITFANGCEAHVDVGGISRIEKQRWYVRGELGALTKRTLGDEHKCVVRTVVDGVGSTMEIEPVAAGWDAYYANVVAHLTEGAELIVKPEQCRTAVACIEAAFISVKEKRAVNLKDLGVRA
jgi:scyllo-inositol 2-dehydrogenase (NADP+)